jgi:hypothetical protein
MNHLLILRSEAVGLEREDMGTELLYAEYLLSSLSYFHLKEMEKTREKRFESVVEY